MSRKTRSGCFADDELDRLDPVTGLADDLHIRFVGEQTAQLGPGGRLVVDDDDPDHVLASLCPSGRVSVTAYPPSRPGPASMAASPPCRRRRRSRVASRPSPVPPAAAEDPSPSSQTSRERRSPTARAETRMRP